MHIKNTRVLNFYFLIQPLTSLISIFISTYIAQYLIILSLFIYALIINRCRFKKSFLLSLIGLITLSSLNVLLAKEQSYVIPDALNFFVFLIIPLYVMTSNKVDYKYLSKLLFNNAIFLTLLLPYFYYLRQNNYINYFDMGIVCHTSIICMGVHYATSSKNKFLDIIIVSINLIVGLIFGSRTVVLASVVVVIIAIIFQSKKKSLGYWISIVSIALIAIFFVYNIQEILMMISDILQANNIRSRNINLFILQLQSNSITEVFSGRNEIYPIIIDYLSLSGFLPSGFGMARVITNGNYYHAHNFILEIFLILGIPLSLLFFAVILNKISRLLKHNKYLKIFIMLNLVSFSIRGVFGTHFITDTFLLIGLSCLIVLGKVETGTPE